MRQVNGQASKSVPAQFVFTIGGFGGPQQEVRWRRGRLWYRTDDSQVKVAPSVEDWEIFWARMDRIGIWNWEASYDNPEIMDGTQWSIDLSDGARSMRCFGSNQYPGGQDLESARPFQEFLQAVGALVRFKPCLSIDTDGHSF